LVDAALATSTIIGWVRRCTVILTSTRVYVKWSYCIVIDDGCYVVSNAGHGEGQCSIRLRIRLASCLTGTRIAAEVRCTGVHLGDDVQLSVEPTKASMKSLLFTCHVHVAAALSGTGETDDTPTPYYTLSVKSSQPPPYVSYVSLPVIRPW
jgi:hypothetical protein